MADLRFHGRPVAAVTFDLWETLITDNVETIRIRDALRCTRVSQALALEGWGMDVPVVRVTQAVAEVDARCLAIRSKSGDVTITQQVGFLLDALQVAEDARGAWRGNAIAGGGVHLACLRSPAGADARRSGGAPAPQRRRSIHWPGLQHRPDPW